MTNHPNRNPMNRNTLKYTLVSLVATLASVCTHAGETETIVLTNGTTLVGEVTSEADGQVVFKDSVLGTLTLEDSSISSRQSHHAGSASASAPTASQHPVTPPVVTTPGPPSTDPNKPVWTRGLQLNYSYMSAPAPDLGVGATTNIGASLVIERASIKNIASFSASYNWSQSRPGPVSVDNETFGFQFDHLYTEKVRFISRSTYLSDRPKKIDYRFEELAAIGYTFVKSPKAFLLIAPGLGYSEGDKEFVGADQSHFGYGLYETFNYNFTPTLSIEQRLFYFGAFETGDYYVYNGYIGIKGQITRMLAMTVGWNITHDNQMAPGIEKTNQMVTSGVQIKF